jgi:hypothetical protein
MTATQTKRCMYKGCERPHSAKGMCKSHYMAEWWRLRHKEPERRTRSTMCVLDVFDTFDVDNGWLTMHQIHAALEVVRPGYTLAATRRLVQRMVAAGMLERRKAPFHRVWPNTNSIEVRPA